MTTSATGSLGIGPWPRNHPRHQLILLATCLSGVAWGTFPIAILVVSLRDVAKELGTQPSTLTWVTTMPMLGAAVTLPILGRLGDLRGNRRVHLAGLGTAAVFAALSAVAWDAPSLILFRTIGHIGAAATMPQAMAVLFRAYPLEARTRLVSLHLTVQATASGAGLVVSGPIINAVGWRPIFLGQAVLLAVTYVATRLVLERDDRAGHGRLDHAGAMLLAASVFGLTFGLNRLAVIGPTWWIVASLVAAPFAGFGFWAVERRAQTPIVPAHLVSNPDVRTAIGISLLCSAAWFATFVLVPLALGAVLGLSAGQIALATLPRVVVMSLAVSSAPRITKRYGEPRTVAAASLALGATSVLLFAGGTATASLALLVLGSAVSGLLFGHYQPAVLSLTVNAAGPGNTGLATSLQQTAHSVGQFMGLGLLTPIAADATEAEPFVVALVATALLYTAGALLARRAVVRHHVVDVDDVLDDLSPPF